MRKKLLGLLRIAPLALLFAGVASAQTTGTIIGVVTDASTGKPVAGAVIIAQSPTLQGQQTAVTDNTGGYRITLLPPGDYTLTVQLGGYKDATRSDIRLSQDKTIRANMAVVPEAVQMEEQVVRTGTAPVVNIGSAESGAVISKEFMSSVPVGRSFDSIALVAPTAKSDSTGVGFAGAQGVENQYIIDGLNTTDPAFGGRAGSLGNNGPPALRSNFTQEVDVKTGGFNAEYGRATGGILNVVLKSGSNEYHGSVFSTFTPNFLVQPNGNVVGAAGEAIASRLNPSAGSYGLDFGFEVGGPILKDKLWFYGGFAPVVTRNSYERYLRQDVTPANNGGACPDGYTPDGSVHGVAGQCVNAAGDYAQTEVPGSARTLNATRTTYQWVGKLTYLLNENHSVTVTGWGAPSSRSAINGGISAGGQLYNARSNELVYTNDDQTALQARYGGKFLDKRLIAEVQAGWYRFGSTPQDKVRAGVDQMSTPAIEWQKALNVGALEPVAAGFCTDIASCPVYGYTTGGRTGAFSQTSDRYAAKGSASYLFEAAGQHAAKGGVDLELVQYDVTSFYSGGAAYFYTGGLFTAFRGYGTINPKVITRDAAGSPGVEITTLQALNDPSLIVRQRQVNLSQTTSFAYFLQDSYQPSFLPNVTVNAGLRLETQSMENKTFKTKGFSINDNWSPRIQAIWDFTGNGRGKVAGSWGRFYYAMPLDMGNRAFGSDQQLRYNLSPSSCGFNGSSTDPNAFSAAAATFDPRNLDFPSSLGTGFRNTTCSLLARSTGNDIRLTGPPLTPVDPNLQGQYVDQFGAQAEYEVFPDLSVGVDYQGRRQGNVIEDMAPNGSDYFIGNPGTNRNVTFVDPNTGQVVTAGNTTYAGNIADPTTGRLVALTFPKPERSYDGLTFRVTKTFSKNWLAQASYTLSALRGNYSGPFNPDYNGGQLDPGITAEYDLPILMANKKGFLSGDQTHQVKLFGAYTWNLGRKLNVTASGAYNGTSGQPINVLASQIDYGSGMSFLVPRGQGGRTPWVNTVDAGLGLDYTFRPPYAVNFRLDIFNIFNSQQTLEADSNYTFDDANPINQLNCRNKNGASGSDPIAGVQADCQALKYLKTLDGRPVSVNPNYGKAGTAVTAFQAPLSMRFSVAVSF